MTEAIQYIRTLVDKGHNVTIFSCEDPYNTPFHHQILGINRKYIHLVPSAGSPVKPASVDLGLQAKHITAFGVFGHYGIVHGSEVCAAIKALAGDYSHYGPDLQKTIKQLGQTFTYKVDKELRDNIIEWSKHQFEYLKKIVAEKQKTLKGAVRGPIEVFGGIVENFNDADNFSAKVIWHETIDQKLI